MERIEKLKISPRRTRVYSGVIRSRESGAGVEFFGTRAYVPGDPLRHLNWKAGARWDLLITNLFEQERVADVGIILDARSLVEIRADGNRSLSIPSGQLHRWQSTFSVKATGWGCSSMDA